MTTTLTEEKVETADAGYRLSPKLLEQLSKPEVEQSLLSLLEQLPKLEQMISTMAKTYDKAQQICSDPVIREDLIDGAKEVLLPLQDKAKALAATAIEAQEEAAKNTRTIGLLGMLRMLKSPGVQSVLRFSQAYLNLMQSGNNKQGR
ncbi:DUF1641 domain-containing protein [Paenibacillus sp. HB172176]|uniref:DUF1641 domain-containing protein n=1 Tax=Paenibacillus sp. HB172176 TaxID=2493690 RepID=UPI001438D412|nr:DUF1641 domain-containing protein [Paenibacillus sp. HB172176]